VSQYLGLLGQVISGLTPSRLRIAAVRLPSPPASHSLFAMREVRFRTAG